jgi:natural product biosynthesis luciferase-like monooxygenase protein
MEYSLFFFSASAQAAREDYRLVLDCARFADEHGFAAVWTPERHLHPFGGAYPNPAVLGASIAAVTSRVGIRAGSVVLPLHHPLRVAEEWSVVDNLSDGRVGVSFASGWQREDFLLSRSSFDDRRDVTVRGMAQVRALWRGEAVPFEFADGRVEARLLPRPVQPELPVWVTTGGTVATGEAAGRAGANLLTHLLGQDFAELESLIKAYRAAGQGRGTVTLMLHTYLAPDALEAQQTASPYLLRYLRQSADLQGRSLASGGTDIGLEEVSEDDWAALLEPSVRRYLDGGSLVGDVASAAEVVAQAAAAGVDEIACLVDFIDDAATVRAALPLLDRLRSAAA